MSKPIDADWLLRRAKSGVVPVELIESAPELDVRLNAHTGWDWDKKANVWRCHTCNNPVTEKTRYCSYCGGVTDVIPWA